MLASNKILHPWRPLPTILQQIHLLIVAPALRTLSHVSKYGQIDHLVHPKAYSQALVLIVGADVSKQISKINGASRTGRVYKPEELAKTEERKGKRKAFPLDKPQKKNRVSDNETTEFIKL